MDGYYKAEYFSHFNLLVDEKNRFPNVCTSEEKIYIAKNKLLKRLTKLNDAHESKNENKIYKSISKLIAFLEQTNDELSQLIPESNIIHLFEFFYNYQKVSIRDRLLLLFSLLIELNDKSNNNVSIMIKNNFFDIVLNFKAEIQNQYKNKEEKSVLNNIIERYLHVIDSLILFCNQYAFFNQKISEFIIQTINFDFIFDLFEFIKFEKSYKIYKEWLKIVENYFTYFQTTHQIICSDIFSRFLNIFNSLLCQNYEDSNFFSTILNTLSSIINSETIDQINWIEFTSIDYPNILCEFLDHQDYRLIQAASDCISACSLHGFSNFEINISNVLKLAQNYHSFKMYHSLFYAYTLLSTKNNTLVDAFFTEETNDFLNKVFKYRFNLKKEIAMFLISISQLAQPQNIKFLVETKTILMYLYQIYTDSMDSEILSGILACFSKIGPLLISLYSPEQLIQIFTEIIPSDFDITQDSCEFDDEADFLNFQLIQNDFSFLFDVNFHQDEELD